MSYVFRANLLVVLALMCGCIIGTWPTPDADDGGSDRTVAPGGTPLAPELCDEVDNDADGLVDEGCPCRSGEQRGCIGVVEGECGLGVQQCDGGAWLGSCTDVGPPFERAREPGVGIVGVEPAVLIVGGEETMIVTADVWSRCSSIRVQHVEAMLLSSAPQVSVAAGARDDGVAPDAISGDGRFTAGLVNAFGPAVEAQTLRVQVTASVNGRDVEDSTSVELEEP